ncbi:MAG: signal peptidase I [Ruminococcaceae bacterium]|nr:signal peptidase I [Oscillospiraceae bacterium]
MIIQERIAQIAGAVIEMDEFNNRDEQYQENQDVLNEQNVEEEVENLPLNQEDEDYGYEFDEYQPEPEKSKVDWKKELWDWVVSIAAAILIALLIRTFLFTLVRVDGPSMRNTLQHGDTLYVNRFMYEPEVGDIIVFRPPNSPKTPYIKRVIATEGQVVEVDEDTDTVKVDGVVLTEDYIRQDFIRDEGTMKYPYTVPENHIFVMGDNRNESRDSRDATVGAIPVKNVIGHALFRLLPFSEFGTLK